MSEEKHSCPHCGGRISAEDFDLLAEASSKRLAFKDALRAQRDRLAELLRRYREGFRSATSIQLFDREIDTELAAIAAERGANG